MYKIKSNKFPQWLKITQKEWAKLRPDAVPRSINVLLPKRHGTANLENDIAIFLNNKYSDVFIINEKGENVTIKDELDEIKNEGGTSGQSINTLRTMAKEMGIKTWGLSKDEMKILIREARRNDD